MEQDRIVTFDDEGMLRIFDPEQYDEAEALQRQALGYIEKLHAFKEEIEKQMVSISAQGKRIENEKLRAIGIRNQVDGEGSKRKVREREIQVAVHERRMELERHTAEYSSLQRVEEDQRHFMDELSATQGD